MHREYEQERDELLLELTAAEGELATSEKMDS